MGRVLWVAVVLGSIAGFGGPARAQVALGPHGAINLDRGDPHLGFDVVVPLAQLSPSVQLGVWPSYAHVFVDDGHDVELLGCDFPFVFALDGSSVSPFFAPGLGLAFYGDTSLKVNLIGGALFDTGGPVRPFAALAVRLVDGTFVDLLGGVLFEL